MNQVICVLKSGGDFAPAHARALAHNVRAHVTKPYQFTVLTDHKDIDFADRVIPLKHDWEGWWSKIELFRPDVSNKGANLYLDLDTVIVGNIDHLFDMEKFTMLRGFQWKRPASGLMGWQGSSPPLPYLNFCKRKKIIMQRNRASGDQGYIDATFRGRVELDFWQDLFPGDIISYKCDYRRGHDKKGRIDRARVVCFHGAPRPWEVKDEWIWEEWE